MRRGLICSSCYALVLTSFGPSWHCTDRIIGTAVLEYGLAETLPPVGAQWKARRVSADPVVKPAAQTRAESRVLNVRKQKRERDSVCWREMDSNHRFPNRSVPVRPPH